MVLRIKLLINLSVSFILAAYRFFGRFRNRTPFEESPMHEIITSDPRSEHTSLLGSSCELHALLSEYDEYHNTWVTRVRCLQRGT